MSRYAEAVDLTTYSVQPAALARILTADREAALERASRIIDGYLADRYVVPLVVWTSDLRGYCCDIAAFELLTRNGFDSGAQGNSLKLRYDMAMTWLRDVSKGLVTIGGGATIATPTTQARVQTRKPLGWYERSPGDDE